MQAILEEDERVKKETVHLPSLRVNPAQLANFSAHHFERSPTTEDMHLRTHDEGGAMSNMDLEIERSAAELSRRRQLLVERLEQYDDCSPVQIIKSKQKSLYLQTRSTRGSKFRGVSRNGKKWQVRL